MLFKLCFLTLFLTYTTQLVSSQPTGGSTAMEKRMFTDLDNLNKLSARGMVGRDQAALERRAKRTTLASLAAARAFRLAHIVTSTTATTARFAAATSTPKSALSYAQQLAASRLDPYSANGVFLQALAALTAGQSRCSSDVGCASKVVAPTNGHPVCVVGHCSYRCDDGFAPSGIACAPEPSACSGVTCPAVNAGYVSCVPNVGGSGSQCVAACPDSQGLTIFQTSSTAYVCLSLLSDSSNCGAPGLTCPAGYNGGTPRCRNGACQITCPAGQVGRIAGPGAHNGMKTCV